MTKVMFTLWPLALELPRTLTAMFDVPLGASGTDIDFVCEAPLPQPDDAPNTPKYNINSTKGTKDFRVFVHRFRQGKTSTQRKAVNSAAELLRL